MDDNMIGVFIIVMWLFAVLGNSLSAIVWLRHQVTTKNSSAVYLAAIALSDVIYLLTVIPLFGVLGCKYPTKDPACIFVKFAHWFSYTLEPLLVLGFSVERLFAVYRPLQVRFYYRTMLSITPYCRSTSKSSVRSSVPLRYRTGIGWNSSKISASLGCSVFSLCRPQNHGSTAKGTPQILARIGVGLLRMWLWVYETRTISERFPIYAATLSKSSYRL